MHLTIEEAYRVLEIESGSNEEIVKRQYKKLALKTHPDKNPDDPEAHKKFLLISEAYKRITDPDSFKDDDEGEEPNEEEMEAMFNEMFAGLFGMQGFHGHGIPFELFQMFESMVDDDGDEYYYAGGGRGGAGGSYFDVSDDYDEEDGYDDEEGYADMMDNGGFLEAMLLNELLGGMGAGLGGRGGGGRGVGGLPSSSSGRKSVKGNEKKKQDKNKKKKGSHTDSESKKPASSSQTKRAAKMSSSKGNKGNDDGWETDDSEDEIEEEAEHSKGSRTLAEPKLPSKQGSSAATQQKAAKESKKKASGSKSKKFADHDSDDNEYADDSLMEMMMNHMAMELGLPNGEMLQFLIESEMLDGEDDEDDDFDYEDGKSSSPSKASKKNKKKRDKQKKKKAAAAAASAPPAPAPTIPTKSRFGNINVPSSYSGIPSSSSAVPSSSVHPHHQPTPTSYDEMPDLIDASKEIEQLKQQQDPNFLKENGISNPPPASTLASEHTQKKSLESSNGIKLGDRVLITKRFESSLCVSCQSDSFFFLF
jgi:curved DNA-binding protein CbpA